MRLESESICSSWIGSRKLFSSERQVIKHQINKCRKGRKREARDFPSFMDDEAPMNDIWVSACLSSQA